MIAVNWCKGKHCYASVICNVKEVESDIKEMLHNFNSKYFTL